MNKPNTPETIDSKNHCLPDNYPVVIDSPSVILADCKSGMMVNIQSGKKSEKAFNDRLVETRFGKDYLESLKINNQNNFPSPPPTFIRNDSQSDYKGDWYQLACLSRCHEIPVDQRGVDKDQRCCCPFCQFVWGDIHLENANFMYADLKNVQLGGAHLEYVHFEYAHLENALLCNAYLENALLCDTHLERANLRDAILTGATLKDAILDGADVRGAKGIVFDSNRVERLLIEGKAPDPWSVLRRNYTGPSFFFHLLLLTAFFLPYISKAIVLSGVHEGMVLIEKKGLPVLRKIEQDADYQVPLHDAIDKMADKLGSNMESVSLTQEFVRIRKEQFDSKIDPLPSISFYFELLQKWWDNQYMNRKAAFWTLLGYGNNSFYTLIFFLVTLMMIAYNFCRYYLTKEVSFLRDAEERAKVTPSRIEYMGQIDRQFDSRSFWSAIYEAWKSWKSASSAWWKELKGKTLYVTVFAIIVVTFLVFWWISEFFFYMSCLFGLIGIVAWIFGILDDFKHNLFFPAPIKYLGLYRLHQFVNVVMYFGYGVLVIQVFHWLYYTKIPTY